MGREREPTACPICVCVVGGAQSQALACPVAGTPPWGARSHIAYGNQDPAWKAVGGNLENGGQMGRWEIPMRTGTPKQTPPCRPESSCFPLICFLLGAGWWWSWTSCPPLYTLPGSDSFSPAAVACPGLAVPMPATAHITWATSGSMCTHTPHSSPSFLPAASCPGARAGSIPPTPTSACVWVEGSG